ncbi:hypothetical protein VTL71DRAFT_9144 [Oculimacula yallundae]|uniref:Carboxylesterase type B domain-containing protein n=1 Tax=Oculimacula yallundae TaxID=86028 RepID=A0ABR4BTW5_9HELO
MPANWHSREDQQVYGGKLQARPGCGHGQRLLCSPDFNREETVAPKGNYASPPPPPTPAVRSAGGLSRIRSFSRPRAGIETPPAPALSSSADAERQEQGVSSIESIQDWPVSRFCRIRSDRHEATRFGTPKLYSGQASAGVVNATKLGPAAIGIPNGCQLEHGLIQHSLPVPDFPPQSDTECLNLSVTIPHDRIRAGRKLPVFVFIHGGGLAFGSGTWPQNDQAKIVCRSVELGKPIIGVVINYRTNIFGFLTSAELRKANFKANNGLRDQRVAFEWVREHIEGFGGDPRQVTALGQSAGAVSVTTLLQCPEQLFQRMVVLSGSCLLRRPVSLDTHEQFYLEFCKAQGFEGISGDDRIRAIEDRESLELLLKTPLSVPSLPALDHDLLNEEISFEKAKHWPDSQPPALPGLKWCKEIVFGDCEYDASIFARALNGRSSNVAQQLSDSLNRAMPGHETAIAALLDDYGISNTANNSSAFSDNIIKFINGQEPWQASSGESRVALVYGNDAGAGQLRKDEPESVGRRATIFRYQESIGFDALLNAVSDFLAGK